MSSREKRKFGNSGSMSDAASDILLNDVWKTHKELYDEEAVDSAIKKLLANRDTSQMSTWKCSLSFDPVLEFEDTLPPCMKCGPMPLDLIGLKQFQNNTCKCDLSKPPKIQKMCSSERKSKSSSESLNPGKPLEESKFGHGSKHFKPRLGSKQSIDVDQPTTSKGTINVTQEAEFEKEEAENKAHTSNVAKITFKTAKQQLLATNPAARRVLRSSAKAQGKFVSPMIGAQEKQERSEVTITDDRLKHLDPKMVELIESEIIDKGTPIGWEDIAGLEMAKSVIQEAVVWPLLRPDIFTGLRRPPKGILLFGPPGTGKTLIGKCIASQCCATFFNISASSLTSKWLGDGEKMVRALFAVARCHQPAVIFIDEIDSLLTQRSDGEHEATRRIKTEFLVQFDGAATAEEDRFLIVGATNRPQELDEAARRRLVKRLYIPLPDIDARRKIITNLLQSENSELTVEQVSEVAELTDGYSGADVKSLCSEAAMGPIRAVPLSQIVTIDKSQVRPVCVEDFLNALQRVKPSVSQDDLGQYEKWNNTYGHGF